MPPRELVRALRVNVENLRPWEYDGMDAADYESVTTIQRWFRDEMKRARDQAERKAAT